VDESLIIAGDYTRQAAYDLADRLIDMKPDGIFCGNDETALGVLRRTTERGIKVPEDLAIAGFDGTSANEVAAPRLTTIHQPFAEVADKAVKALITSITGSDGPLEQLVVPTIFYGETTKTVEGPDA
jgi:LacI family transcriptional regulator